ncbi:hypothetical protein ACIBBB_35400 [Streptomyces sp. NPDC051217]|uniref:hypothetical protein n=1 Tax=Streptomyces sp. NPDC051217 TaxID=3365644 RepID=UPI0037B74B42
MAQALSSNRGRDAGAGASTVVVFGERRTEVTVTTHDPESSRLPSGDWGDPLQNPVRVLGRALSQCRFEPHAENSRDRCHSHAIEKTFDLGSYTVRVEATGADGDRTTDNSAGSLAYYVAAVLEDVRTDRTEVDNDHREVRVDGILKGRWPATRELKALADHPVDLDVDHWTENTVRTDANGRFSGTVTVNDAVPVQAVYRHSNDHRYVLSGESTPTQIGVRQIATRWTVQAPAHARTIDFGEEVALTATLERETPQGWVPFEGQSGGVLFEPSGGGQSASVGYFTTGQDGKVAFTHAPWETGTFRVASHSDDPFIASASVNSDTIAVLRASVFTSFSATRTQDRGVRVEGAMDFPDSWTPATIPVHIQYSRNGEQWTDLVTTEANWSGSGHAFSADVAGARHGYYRAHFEATDSFRAATSEVVRASR